MSFLCIDPNRSLNDYSVELNNLSASIKAFRSVGSVIHDHRAILIESGIGSKINEISDKISKIKYSIIMDIERINNAECFFFKVSTKRCFYAISSVLDTAAVATGAALEYWGDSHEEGSSDSFKQVGLAMIVGGIFLSKFNDCVSASIRGLQTNESELTSILLLCKELESSAEQLSYLYNETMDDLRVNELDQVDAAKSDKLVHKDSLRRRWKVAVDKLLLSENHHVFARCSSTSSNSSSVSMVNSEDCVTQF